LTIEKFTQGAKREVSWMKLWSNSATALALVGLLIYPTPSSANNLHQNSPKAQIEVLSFIQTQKNDSTTRYVKVLSDHPGRATALTSKQKSEIKKILAKAKGNQNFVCTGLSLAGQRESMYRVVRLRATLVCDYAKSIDPAIKTSVKEKTTKARKLNGRVEVASS
jgi:hypothetical protein